MRGALLCLLLTAATACDRHPARRTLGEEHAAVHALLYRDGLIEDGEVRARMMVYVARMRAGTPPEAAYPEFRRWLERWEREHPGRARAARERFGRWR